MCRSSNPSSLAPLLALLVAPALYGCNDKGVSVYNTAPTAGILAPTDGSSVDAGSLVEFYGTVGDAQTSPPDLLVTWSSDVDGPLDSTPAAIDGSLHYATSSLSSGDHAITLTAVDENGLSAQSTIGLHVGTGSGGPGAPTVVILGPTDAQQIPSGDVTNLVAAVTDEQDAYDTLQVELIDVPDGSLWVGNPSSTGSLTVPMTLSIGDHLLTVNALDSDGNTGSASVAFSIVDNGRPHVTIDTPADGTEIPVNTETLFSGTVSDDNTDAGALALTWADSVDGVLSTAPSDSSGTTNMAPVLSVGIHTVTLTAIDVDGKTGSDSIVVTVYDPNDRDDDGDGYTENEGDCNDADASVNPGEADVCDAIDNNCDGQVNEPWADSYEPNDASPGYDCGTVDVSFLWTGATLQLSALTLQSAADEDWFYWDAVDEYWDNVSVSVTATGFPASGTYVLELWSLDTGSIVDSASGSASLTVSYTGDIFDDSEDHFAARVYAATWPADSCSTLYSLAIHS